MTVVNGTLPVKKVGKNLIIIDFFCDWKSIIRVEYLAEEGDSLMIVSVNGVIV
jgi:hypothetical protein